MTFSDIRGNDEVRQALQGMVESAKVPHAILFHEDDGGGAFPMTVAFLDSLYGGNPRVSKLIHPDVHFIFPTAAGCLSEQYMESFRKVALENPFFTEKEMTESLGLEGRNLLIPVVEANHLLETLSLSALEGGYRSVVVFMPEKMNAEAANKLLKVIEEPPAKTQFVLISHNPENLLQTIASRCQRIRIVPGRVAGAGVSPAGEGLLSDLMSAIISKDLLEAVEVGEGIAALPSRENVKAFCKFASERMRQVFLVQQGMDALGDGTGDVALWASKCRKTFPRLALEAFSRASQLVDRNVNAKIVFTDLVGRLYMSF